MILQNVGDHSPNNTASHLSKHKILSKTAATTSILAQVATQLRKFCVISKHLHSEISTAGTKHEWSSLHKQNGTTGPETESSQAVPKN